MAYLIDADWVIHVLAGRQPATAALRRLAGARISISIVTVSEIYEGAFRSTNPAARLATYRGFLSTFWVLPVTDRTADLFGETRAHLHRHGTLIADMDLFIAVTALEHDLTLLTFNVRHFARVPGLRIWQSEPR